MAGLTFRPYTESVSITSITAEAGADTIVECPPNHVLEITYLVIANESNQNRNFSVEFYHKAHDNWHHLVKTVTVLANGYLQLVDGSSLYLAAGDKLGGHKYDVLDEFSVTVSGRLYYSPNNQ